MRCSADRLIEALIAVQMMDFQRQQSEKEKQPTKPNVVTISRECGSLGAQVAQLLADALEVRCCDRIILQEVARRAHVDEKLVEALDQHVSKIGGHWWQKLLHKDALSYEDYYQNLVKTVMSISRTGGVILGRGANLIPIRLIWNRRLKKPNNPIKNVPNIYTSYTTPTSMISRTMTSCSTQTATTMNRWLT